MKLQERRQLKVSFNCTIMELKLTNEYTNTLKSYGFNCTIMELKSDVYTRDEIDTLSFNCTIMELKSVEAEFNILTFKLF